MSDIRGIPRLMVITRAAAGLFIALIVAFAGGAPVADAGTAKSLRIVRINEDAFYNYDFLPRPNDPFGPNPPDAASKYRVDWPVNLLFWHNASRAALAEQMPNYPAVGNAMYGRTNDGGAWQWKGDGGLKTKFCPGSAPGQNVVHFRAYGNANNSSLYNTIWGFYLPATSHLDHRECSAHGKWSGYSERAEKRIAADSRQIWGATNVEADWYFFGNQEPLRKESHGHHIWQNNGSATLIYIP